MAKRSLRRSLGLAECTFAFDRRAVQKCEIPVITIASLERKENKVESTPRNDVDTVVVKHVHVGS